MRILFDYQAFSIQPRGGISRYVLELAERFAAEPGLESLVYAGWHRSEMLRHRTAPWLRGRYVRPLPRTGPIRHQLNRWLTRRLASRWQPDLIHETYFRPGRAYVPDIPTVVTVYDLTYFVIPEAQREAAAVRRAQQQAIARADHVICISENTRADLMRFLPVAAERVSVIPLAGPAPESSGPAAPTPPPLAGPYFLHVGLRNSYKNFGLLAQALAGSPALQTGFRLVAFGGGDLTAAEKAHWRALGLADDRLIHRTGDDAELARYYTHATAFVCPSLYEGFGLPVLEAMARNCPVVCSNRGSLPEVAGDAAHFFDPDQPETLTAALAKVADSPTFAAEMRRRGLAQTARFSWARCARETLEVYQRVLA